MPTLTANQRFQPFHTRVAVSGASGFLGAVVARESVKRGGEVLAWSRSISQLGSSGAGPAPRTEAWPQDPHRLASQISEFQPDCIVHCAGSASVAASLTDPHADLMASFGTWSLMLEAVRLSGQRPLLIFPSSAAVYGNPQMLPVGEDAPLLPISPYGVHKKLCEDLAASYQAHFGLPILIVRLFSVFGPTQRRLLVRELFEKCASSDQRLVIGGTGLETRDFLSEWCVADAILCLASQGKVAPPSCHSTFNLASGRELSILEMASSVRDLICPERPIECLGQIRPGDPTRWHADISRLRAQIPEWAPRPFALMLDQTIREWRSEAKN